MDGVHRSPRRHRFNRRRQRRRSGVDTAASSQSDGMDSYVKTSSTADFLEHLLKYRRRPAKTSDPVSLQKVTRDLSRLWLSGDEPDVATPCTKNGGGASGGGGGGGGAKKKKTTPSMSVTVVSRTLPRNRQQTVNRTVDEWLRHRSAHYHQWWKTPAARPEKKPRPSYRQTGRPMAPPDAAAQPAASWRRTKNQRCVLWFRFTGHPTTTTPASASVVGRRHAIRVEQQPLGGTPALVFAADLHTGEEFAMVSRRQPGFTLSLTFYIDGYRDARLSGCCEGARHLRTPTRIGGPSGAFVLRAVHGNATPCSVCEKGATFDPALFTVRPKCRRTTPTRSKGADVVVVRPSRPNATTWPETAKVAVKDERRSPDIVDFFTGLADDDDDHNELPLARQSSSPDMADFFAGLPFDADGEEYADEVFELPSEVD